MSLKAFHIAFITCSTLLALGLAGWAWTHGFAGLAVGGVAVAVLLVVYGAWFLKKMKGVSYL